VCFFPEAAHRGHPLFICPCHSTSATVIPAAHSFSHLCHSFLFVSLHFLVTLYVLYELIIPQDFSVVNRKIKFLLEFLFAGTQKAAKGLSLSDFS
jgi:hypothetical protein